jgi:mRNA interferase MazF
VKRGDLFRVRHPSARDPKKSRVFVVVSRQVSIDSRFSTTICAPIYSAFDGLSTQVPVGVEQGLKHESAIHCDELVSLPKALLTDYVGSLEPSSLGQLDRSLAIALGLQPLPVAPPISVRRPGR